jgi:glycosyltransferase involved in cell wall biosynthesis
VTVPSVLVVHNHYQHPGGEDHVFAAETALLENRGHRVIRYAVHNDDIREMSTPRLAKATLWNAAAYDAVRSVIRRERPDFAHFHNTFPLLSPAVYHAAKAEGVPVIQTLHNYRLLCSNAMLFRDGRPCNDCVQRKLAWPGVLHRCYRNSRAASLGVAAMLALHDAIHTWRDCVDLYLALTPFARDKFIEGGFPADRIFVKPNFVDPDPGAGTGQGDYALFVGRISEEKGIRTLLDAWALLGNAIPLRVIGDGPLAGWAEETSRRMSRVEVLGWKPLEDVLTAMKDARFLIFPSVWYETFGLVVVQAFAAGLPVIASGHGAMTSLIQDGLTGLHFRPGDPADLARQVRWALDHPSELSTMRRQARDEYEARYSADRNYTALMEAYALARVGLAPRRTAPPGRPSGGPAALPPD